MVYNTVAFFFTNTRDVAYWIEDEFYFHVIAVFYKQQLIVKNIIINVCVIIRTLNLPNLYPPPTGNGFERSRSILLSTRDNLFQNSLVKNAATEDKHFINTIIQIICNLTLNVLLQITQMAQHIIPLSLSLGKDKRYSLKTFVSEHLISCFLLRSYKQQYTEFCSSQHCKRMASL